MTTELPRLAWYSDLRQWIGIGMLFIVVLLAIVLLCLKYRQTRTTVSLVQTKEDCERTEARGYHLRSQADTYRGLLSKNQADKERLVREIADFRSGLALLKQKVAGLERVRTKLQGLEAAWKTFQASEEKFLKERREWEHRRTNSRETI